MRELLRRCPQGQARPGTAGKVAVFGLLERSGKVLTAIVRSAKASTELSIIDEKVTPDSIVYTDTFKPTGLILFACEIQNVTSAQF